MSEVVLSATSRDDTGKKIAKQLRREGKIPAIYYAHGEKPVPLFLDEKEAINIISGSTGLINLSIDDKKIKKCIVKEIQFDPIKNTLVHIDMMGVRLKEKVHVSVPIVVIGESIGVKEQGAVMTQSIYELEVSCLPLDIPEKFEIDVTSLKVGDSIHVKDMHVDKVDIVNDPDVVIVSVVSSRGLEIEPTEVEEEEEEVSEEPQTAEE